MRFLRLHTVSRCTAIALAAALAIGFALAPATPARAAVVDRILATVGPEAILLSDVMIELGPSLAEMRVTSEAEFQRIFQDRMRATLDQAIENRLLLREALMAGVNVDEDLVEEHLDRLRETEGFAEFMQASGATMSEMRELTRKRLMALRVSRDMQRRFANEVTVSESEVAQYYEDNRSEFNQPAQAVVRQIFLRAPSNDAEREKVRARLEEIRAELDAGGDFAELAKAYSEAPGAEDGGIIGEVTLSNPRAGVSGDLVPALDQAVSSLDEGETSDVVATDFGFHILRVEERQEAGMATLDDVRTEIEPIIRNQKANERYGKWLADLRKRSQVRVFLE